MKVVLPEQMKDIDAYCINQLGIPGIVLMENAALAVVKEIIEHFSNICGKKVILFAGKGNNGGDAFAVARHLYNQGVLVTVFLIGMKNDVCGDAKTNLDIVDKMGIEVIEINKESQLTLIQNIVDGARLVVDGILGTGIYGEVKGLVAQIIEIINNAHHYVLSIDIPSGINGETGKVMGICIKASKTVTFGLPKLGLLLHPAIDYCGEIIVADIGIPKQAIDVQQIKTHLLDKKLTSKLMPIRMKDSNKGSYGRNFIITGSVGMTGAGSLAAKAALRTGAGLVYLGVPSTLASTYNISITEAITIPLADTGVGSMAKESISLILDKIKRMDVTIIGPGLSTCDSTVYIVKEVIKNSKCPLVIDADALNAISTDVGILRDLQCEAIVTPHPGEMARLTGMSIQEVQNNRIKVAREFSTTWKVITVLKGANTVITLPDGSVYINQTGNAGMATAGTGDVLAGIIASFVGQGLAPSDAAIAGVYVHGLAGDQMAMMKGEHGLIASDVVEQIPYVIKEMTMFHKKALVAFL